MSQETHDFFRPYRNRSVRIFSQFKLLGEDREKLYKTITPEVLPEELGGKLPAGDVLAKVSVCSERRKCPRRFRMNDRPKSGGGGGVM